MADDITTPPIQRLTPQHHDGHVRFALLVPVPIDATSSARELVGHVLGVETLRMVRHDPVARADQDPEGVHQLRVATRRLRSHVRTLRRVLDPEWVTVVRAELQWLGRTLGDVRDLDVMRDVLSACAASLPSSELQHLEPVFHTLAAERAGARDQMFVVLQSDRYHSILDWLVNAAAEPPMTRNPPASQLAPRIAVHAWKPLQREVEALGERPDDAALHAVRVRSKRARYAAEAVAPVVGRDAFKFAKAMTNVQSLLGTQHDAVVAQRWVREHAVVETPQASFAAGMVAGLLRAAAASAAAEFPAVWAKASRKKIRSWFE